MLFTYACKCNYKVPFASNVNQIIDLGDTALIAIDQDQWGTNSRGRVLLISKYTATPAPLTSNAGDYNNIPRYVAKFND